VGTLQGQVGTLQGQVGALQGQYVEVRNISARASNRTAVAQHHALEKILEPSRNSAAARGFPASVSDLEAKSTAQLASLLRFYRLPVASSQSARDLNRVRFAQHIRCPEFDNLLPA
jgi:hypothetical protein